MDRLKAERKGLEFKPPAKAGFDVLSLGSRHNGNGHVEKDSASLLSALGFQLTPSLAGNEEITQPYLESWVVHACLRAISDAVEQVGFNIWTGPEATATKLPEDHPLVKLFARPNPWTSWSQHVAMGSIHRNLSGEDFWFLADKDGNPIIKAPVGEDGKPARPVSTDPMEPIDVPFQIQSVNGTYVRDDRDTFGHVTYWWYGGSSRSSPKFPAGSVLHFRDYDPTDPVRGLGPVEVALRQLAIAFQAERYGEATLRAGGPGAFIIYKNEMSPETQKGFQEEIDTKVSDPKSVGSFKVLTGEVSVVPIPVSPKDMLSLDQLKWSRDVVASLLGVPLPIIGVLDMATYSNMKEAWRQFWLRRAAYLKTVEDVVNTSFFPRLKNVSYQKLRFAFDLSNVAALKGDDKDLIELALKILMSGTGITWNEALKMVGSQVENIKGGDVILFLAQMQTEPSSPKKDQAQKFLKLLLEEIEHASAHSQA